MPSAGTDRHRQAASDGPPTLPAFAACAGMATLGFSLLTLTSIAQLVEWFRYPGPGLMPNWAVLDDALGVLGYLALAGAVAAALVATSRRGRWLRPALFVAVAGLVLRATSTLVWVVENYAYLHHELGFPYLHASDASEVIGSLSGLTLATAAAMALVSTGEGGGHPRRRAFAPCLALAATGFALESLSQVCDLVENNALRGTTNWVWVPALVQTAGFLLLAAAVLAAWRAARGDLVGGAVVAAFPAGAIGLALLGVANLLGAASYGSLPLTTLQVLAVVTICGQVLQALAAVVALGALLGRMDGSPSSIAQTEVVTLAATE